MSYKYAVGDTVKISEHVTHDQARDWGNAMSAYLGVTTVIEKHLGFDEGGMPCYSLAVDCGWCWHESMLTLVKANDSLEWEEEA